MTAGGVGVEGKVGGKGREAWKIFRNFGTLWCTGPIQLENTFIFI